MISFSDAVEHPRPSTGIAIKSEIISGKAHDFVGYAMQNRVASFCLGNPWIFKGVELREGRIWGKEGSHLSIKP